MNYCQIYINMWGSVYKGITSITTFVICFVACDKTEEPSKLTYLFLGNSITYGGRYVDYIETALLLKKEKNAPVIIDLGLSSETLTGISEEDHPFPRPSLLDRLSACLDSVKPDRVIACYGINCGIYHPFDSMRFEGFKQGINQLIREVRERGISLTLLTPGPFASDVAELAPFDSLIGYSYRNPYQYYDRVMDTYSQWITKLDTLPEVSVVDIRTPLKKHIEVSYSQKDPIHPNSTGHAIIAEAILECWHESAYQSVLTTGVDLTQTDTTWQNLENLVNSQRLAFDRPLLNYIGHDHPAIMESIAIGWQEAKIQNGLFENQIKTQLQEIR